MASVIVYGKQDCEYSAAAKALLRTRGFEFEEIDVGHDPGRRAEMVRRSGGRSSTPQIFIDGRPIGGFDDLKRMADQGQLDVLAEVHSS